MTKATAGTAPQEAISAQTDRDAMRLGTIAEPASNVQQRPNVARPNRVRRSRRDDTPLTTFSRLAVCGIFIIALFVVMKLMSELLMPIVAAVIVGSVLSRVSERLAAFGAPRIVVGIGLVVVTGFILFFLIYALLDPLSNMIAQAPSMLSTLLGAVQPMLTPINDLKNSLHLAGPSPTSAMFNVDYGRWFSALVGGVSPAIGGLFVFFATLAFFVVGRVSMRQSMIMAWQKRSFRMATMRIITAIEESLEVYFLTIGVFYLVVGALTGLIAYVFGLSNPMLWGALTFVVSFIPYFGAALITLSLAAGGIVAHQTLGLGLGLAPAAAYLVVNLVSDNVIMPMFLGQRLNINPFVVFVAIVFWTWMWGPIGAVMAVPLLLVGETILSELRPQSPELPV